MEVSAPAKTSNDENQMDIKGNGKLKRKHGVDASSDDENDFLGFDLGKKGRKLAPICDLIVTFYNFIAKRNKMTAST